jgi:hypothetical protein
MEEFIQQTEKRQPRETWPGVFEASRGGMR